MLSLVAGATTAVSEEIDSSNQINIHLNNHIYVGGEIVSGSVEIDCVVPFNARGVVIKFKGFERVWWQQKITEWHGDGAQRRAVERIIDHKQNKEFFRQAVIVFPHSGPVSPGHYSFPFQYQLPPGLPGTFYDKGGDTLNGTAYHAMVLYKAKATVDVQYKHKLHCTTRLVVNEKFDQLMKPSFGENSKSFMFADGTLNTRVWLDKNAYFPGETVIAKLKANNTSIKPTRRINIKVFHILEMRAHGHIKQIPHTEHVAEYDGFDPCFLGVRWLPFSVPVSRMRPSCTAGEHVNSSYVFQVSCDIPGAVDLKVNLPLRILAPQFLWSESPVQPPNAPIPPNVQIRPPWQPDEQAPKCTLCSTSFGLFTGRTHCRHCSKVFCRKCASTELPIPKLKFREKVRVCNTCIPVVKQSGGVKFQSTKAVLTAWQQTLPNLPATPAQPLPPSSSSYSISYSSSSASSSRYFTTPQSYSPQFPTSQFSPLPISLSAQGFLPQQTPLPETLKLINNLQPIYPSSLSSLPLSSLSSSLPCQYSPADQQSLSSSLPTSVTTPSTNIPIPVTLTQ